MFIFLKKQFVSFHAHLPIHKKKYQYFAKNQPPRKFANVFKLKNTLYSLWVLIARV